MVTKILQSLAYQRGFLHDFPLIFPVIVVSDWEKSRTHHGSAVLRYCTHAIDMSHDVWVDFYKTLKKVLNRCNVVFASPFSSRASRKMTYND